MYWFANLVTNRLTDVCIDVAMYPSSFCLLHVGELCSKGQEVFQECLLVMSQTVTVNKS